MDTLPDLLAEGERRLRRSTEELRENAGASYAADRPRREPDADPTSVSRPIFYPGNVMGMPSSRPGYSELRCVFCDCWWPMVAVLTTIPLCLHCAAFDGQTRRLASHQIEETHSSGFSTATKFVPYNWKLIQGENEGRSCLRCGIVGGQPGNPSSTLGIEHLCIACVIRRETATLNPGVPDGTSPLPASGVLTLRAGYDAAQPPPVSGTLTWSAGYDPAAEAAREQALRKEVREQTLSEIMNSVQAAAPTRSAPGRIVPRGRQSSYSAAARAAKVAEAARLKAEGRSWAQIGANLGVPPATLHRWWQQDRT